MENLSPG